LVKMKPGFKAIKCWACDLYQNIWILATKDGDPSVRQIFAAGGDYDMVGCGDGTAAPDWREPIFPAGTYMKSIASSGMSAYGIDQDDNLWEWGDHKIKNRANEPPVWEKAKPDGEEKRSHPYKIVWFQNNGKVPV
jgi:alpha-tubulin suppressor-like RCC1 family protein